MKRAINLLTMYIKNITMNMIKEININFYLFLEEYFMANTINVNIRVDEEVKKQTEVLLSEMGLNMTTAVNIFLRQVLRTGGIPFEITTRTDDFYNPVNQQRLCNSIERLEKGLGTVHDIIEVDE